MGPAVLDAAVILLLPVFCVMVSAEMCPNAQTSGPLCKEVCSLSHFMENMVRQINTCLNDTSSWTVTNADPVIVLTPNNNNNNHNNKEGNRKTFTWRHFCTPPPGAGTIQNLCTICIPRRPNTARTRVKSVKQIPELQRIPVQANVNPVSADISRIAVGRKQGERGGEKQELTPQGRAQVGGAVPSEQVERDKEQVDGERVIQKTALQGSAQAEGVVPLAQDKKTVLTGSVRRGTGLEGVCPGINALECLAVMKVEKSNQGQTNVEKLNDPQYSDNSFKIKISGNEGRKVEFSNNQLEHLRVLGASYCNRMNPGQKPRVVHVENTSTNDVSKYVIVEEVGDMMIGCPYPPPAIRPVPTKGQRPGTRGIALTPSRGGGSGTSTEANWIKCWRRSFEHPELLSHIRPEPLVRNYHTHFTPDQRGFEGTARPEPSRHDYQIFTDLPKYRTHGQYGLERGNTGRPYLYNVGFDTTRFPHERCTWGAEDILPEIEENPSHGNENSFIPNEAYNSNDPNSYWRGETTQFTPNVPNILETPCNDMYDKYWNRDNTYHRFPMNTRNNYNRQPLISRRKLLGNTVQPFNQEPTQRPRGRFQPIRMPELLRSTQKYGSPEQWNSRSQRVFQDGSRCQGETRPTLSNGYNQNRMNGARKAFKQQEALRCPTWRANVAPRCQFPRVMTRGRYGAPYPQRGYPRPTDEYPSMSEPVQSIRPPPIGYTLAPELSQQMRMVSAPFKQVQCRNYR